MKKKTALWNFCPECKDKVMWMPYEGRCGSCGYGGKPIHSEGVIPKSPVDSFWTIISKSLAYSYGSTLLFIAVVIILVYVFGFISGWLVR